MTLPTDERIAQALEEIRQRGADADITLSMAVLCRRNREIRELIDTMTDAAGSMKLIGGGPMSAAQRVALMGLVLGAYMAGLNLGLTVETQRGAKA